MSLLHLTPIPALPKVTTEIQLYTHFQASSPLSLISWHHFLTLGLGGKLNTTVLFYSHWSILAVRVYELMPEDLKPKPKPQVWSPPHCSMTQTRSETFYWGERTQLSPQLVAFQQAAGQPCCTLHGHNWFPSVQQTIRAMCHTDTGTTLSVSSRHTVIWHRAALRCGAAGAVLFQRQMGLQSNCIPAQCPQTHATTAILSHTSTKYVSRHSFCPESQCQKLPLHDLTQKARQTELCPAFSPCFIYVLTLYCSASWFNTLQACAPQPEKLH